MSKSRCPYPDTFDLLYNARCWTRDGEVNQLIEATAVKCNGWYTIYRKAKRADPWRRTVYASGMRWYDLERKIRDGICVLLDDSENEIPVDISNLL